MEFKSKITLFLFTIFFLSRSASCLNMQKFGLLQNAVDIELNSEFSLSVYGKGQLSAELKKEIKAADFWKDADVAKWVGSQASLDVDYVVIIRDTKTQKICAYAGFYIKENSETYIAQLAVHQDYRHKGLSQKLLRAVENTALRHKCIVLTLFVYNDNKNAINAYQKYGFLNI